MIIITDSEDIYKIKDKHMARYVKKLFSIIVKQYCPNCSLEHVGAIFILESKQDLKEFEKMGVSIPNSPDEFDFVEKIDNENIDCCLAINNSFAINIIGKRKYFNKDDE